MLKSNITSYYCAHEKKRISQGDILRDMALSTLQGKEVIEITYPYLIIITQDCDLENYTPNIKETEPSINNQFLPNILLLPGYQAETLRAGKHLIPFKILTEQINSDRWNIIKKNHNHRYHFLNSDSDKQVPDLVIDFKTYLTIPYTSVKEDYNNKYLATISELFRECLSQRFTYYLSRIALPIIEGKRL